MGFKEYRALLIEALRAGQYRHEGRLDSEQKNLLQSRVVPPEFVVRLLQRCAGWEYSTSKHHVWDVDCHVFTPTLGGERWYVKAYFDAAEAVFISVHR